MSTNLSIGFLSNLNWKIQRELFRKMEESKGELGSQSVRAVWIKMTSGCEERDESSEDFGKQVVLMGGVLGQDNKLLGGFDNLYSFGDPITSEEKDSHGEKFRPMAGITSLDSSTDGSYGSLKKATVKWQCWSMKDLDRLGKHFMTVGRTIMIEWGWSAVAGQIRAFGKDEIVKAAKEGKKRIFDNGGNYEVISGVIKNFGWTSNEDGGFDCETEIISHGTPMVDAGCADDTTMTTSAGSSDSEEAAEAIKRLGLSNLKKYLSNMKLEVLRHMNPGTKLEDGWFWGASVPDADNYEVNGMPVEYRDGMSIGSLAFVSWGYFEDNVMSKYLGRATPTGKIKYTMRSIDAHIDPTTEKISYHDTQCSNHPKLE